MNNTVENQYRILFNNLATSSNLEKESLFCNADFLRNTRKKVMRAYRKAINNSTIQNFTDEYSPYLLSLREKYANKKQKINSLNNNFTQNSANFEAAKQFYVSTAQKTIKAFDNAIEKLNYISKYKLLSIKSDLDAEFAKFKSEAFPVLISNATRSFMELFSNFSVYCSPDLFNSDCEEGMVKNLEETEIIKSFLSSLDEIASKDLSEPKLIDEEKLIVLVKQAKKSLEYTRDIVQKKEYTGLFRDLAKEFEEEAGYMSKYLSDLKPFEPSDLVLTENTVNITKADNITDKIENLAEPEFNISKFKQHFLNLLDSASYICFAVKNSAFTL